MKSYPTFQTLQQHFNEFKSTHISELFNDPSRVDNFTFKEDILNVDLSKNLITTEIIDLFIQLASEMNIQESIQAMFLGDKINFTEKRAVLHTSLRTPNIKAFGLQGNKYINDIHDTQQKFYNFVDKIRQGIIISSTNKKFNYVVNIGIGGSYLGTKMVYNALKEFDDTSENPLSVHFISNVDASNLIDVLNQIELDQTLFVVASKSFATAETLMNATTIKQHISSHLGSEAISKHFVAVSANVSEAANFGVNPNWIFPFWDFIGGRYSIWSSIGLPIALKIGSKNFQEFLQGAHLMDTHFQNTPFNSNIPFLLSIISLWYNDFFKYNSYAIIPYDYRLRHFTQYIQQLEMESNGKSINKLSRRVAYNTSPIVFGGTGTDAQHSFFQMLHQGTTIVPCDFIGFINPNHNYNQHHLALMANMFAQSEALMTGKSEQAVINEMSAVDYSTNRIKALAPHKMFEGNRPSNTILFESLTPKALGMLCALYEHKTFIQGLFFQINSFDQWGVELGKKLAKHITNDLSSETIKYTTNPSTLNLINLYQNKQ